MYTTGTGITTTLSTLISSLSLNHNLYADDTQLFFSFCQQDLDLSMLAFSTLFIRFLPG